MPLIDGYCFISREKMYQKPHTTATFHSALQDCSKFLNTETAVDGHTNTTFRRIYSFVIQSSFLTWETPVFLYNNICCKIKSWNTLNTNKLYKHGVPIIQCSLFPCSHIRAWNQCLLLSLMNQCQRSAFIPWLESANGARLLPKRYPK